LPDSQAVLEFFLEEFPDAVPLIPNLAAELPGASGRTVGNGCTQHPGTSADNCDLLGDDSHAIVPFHGQGMNAAFEDCVVLDSMLDGCEDWQSLFAEFERVRRPNTQAIAQMALENYTEMRDTVLDPALCAEKSLALELERRFPTRFIPRYAMVMFHPQIPYAEALRRGEIHRRSSWTWTRRDCNTDFALAEQLISERLAPLARA